MHNAQTNPLTTAGRSLIGATLAAITLSGFATPAHATDCGFVNIKGRLYDSAGEILKVKCKGSDLNVMAADPGVRIFLIDPSCPLYAFTGTSDEFEFSGAEVTVSKAGTPTKARKFGGVETGTGPVIGTADSMAKTAGVLGPVIRDKGRIAWNTGDFIFSGQYKAKLEPCS